MLGKIIKIILVAILFLLVLNPIYALTLGISPPRVFAENLLRGSHFEKTVELSKSDIGEELKVTVQVEGQINSWVSTNRGTEFTFPKDANTLPITIIIDVPKDANNGEYEATVNIRVMPIESSGQVSVGLGVPVLVKTTVTGEQLLDYTISSIKIPSTEEDDPINIFITIDNKGNVKAQPTKVHVDIMDKFKRGIVYSKDFKKLKSIEPFKRDQILIKMRHKLPSEQYWAIVKVYNSNTLVKEDEVIFDILKDGNLLGKSLVELTALQGEESPQKEISTEKSSVNLQFIGIAVTLISIIVVLYYGKRRSRLYHA